MYYFYHLDYPHTDESKNNQPITMERLSKTPSFAALRAMLSPSIRLPGEGWLLVTHAEVYATAIKYSVLNLKGLAHDYFKAKLEWLRFESPDSARCVEIAHAIKPVYAASPVGEDALRNLMSRALNGNGKKLLENEGIRMAVESVDGLTDELEEWQPIVSGITCILNSFSICGSSWIGAARR